MSSRCRCPRAWHDAERGSDVRRPPNACPDSGSEAVLYDRTKGTRSRGLIEVAPYKRRRARRRVARFGPLAQNAATVQNP